MTGFNDIINRLTPDIVSFKIEASSTADVKRALAKSKPSVEDAYALFSHAALPFLEEMAERSRAITLKRFGRTIILYAPIYLSNYCINECAYCGFAVHREITRKLLTIDEAVAQAEYLSAEGIRHFLLVTGEAPRQCGLGLIGKVVKAVRQKAASVSVEIFPCGLKGYNNLIQAGVDGLTLYQETYDKDLYKKLHPSGPKQNFVRRLTAIEKGGHAGFRSLGIGFLLGLAPFRTDALYLALHCDCLSRSFPQSRLAISFPRLLPVSEGLQVLHNVSDVDLVQMIAAMRLLFPDAEIVISTRESAKLRDHLLPLGITRISAGSRTSPGGYGGACIDAESGQFETEDRRQISEVAEAVRKAGYDVVTKDFDPAFMDIGS